jgi:hypothetical protein
MIRRHGDARIGISIAVDRWLKDGTITGYVYDPKQAALVHVG